MSQYIAVQIDGQHEQIARVRRARKQVKVGDKFKVALFGKPGEPDITIRIRIIGEAAVCYLAEIIPG